MADSPNRKLSWHSVVDSIRACLTRFPMTVTYALLLTAWLVALIWINASSDEWYRIRDVITYWFSAGTLLTLGVYLWHEEYAGSKPATTTQLIANLLLIADCAWLYVCYQSMGPALTLGHSAVVSALAISIFTGSFIRSRSDMPSWNFSYTLITSAITSACIGLVMTAATAAIFRTLNALLGFGKTELWLSMWLVCAVTIPSLIFLGRIPDGAAKHNSMASPSRFLTTVAKFLFLPTVGIFYGVLYVYAAKIALNCELPQNSVCWPVSAAILSCLVIEYLLYPVRMMPDSSAKVENAIARWLPAALMPLLVLMSISILHRIAEYGVTLSRLYILTLNVWAYAVCIILFLTRARMMRWIPVTCAAIFLATSVLPWANYANLTEHLVRKELKHELTALGVTTFPLTQIQYNEATDSLKRTQLNSIEGKLHYLQDSYGEESLAPVVTVDKSKQRDWSTWDVAQTSDTEVIEEEVVITNLSFWASGDIDIPAGCKRMSQRKTIWKLKPDSTVNGRIWFNARGCTFSVNADSLLRQQKAEAPELPIICLPEQGDSCIQATVVRVTSYDHGKTYDIDGYLFLR